MSAGSSLYPPELLGPLPRRVVRTSWGPLEALLMIFLLFLVVTTGFEFYAVVMTIAVDRFGVSVAGSIVRLDPVIQTRDGKGRLNQSFNVVSYGYRAGDVWQNRQTVLASSRIFGELQVGQTVEVRVLPGYPGMFDRPMIPTARDPWSELRGIAVVWLFAFGLPTLVVGGMAWHSERWFKRLVRFGRPTSGVVTDKKMVQTKSKDYYLSYRFLADEADDVAQRVARTGRVQVAQQQYEATSLGDLVTVLYDTSRPDRHLAYDYTSYRAV